MDVSIKRYPFVNDIVHSFKFLSLRGGNDTSQGMDYGVAGLGCYMFNQLGMLYPKKFRKISDYQITDLVQSMQKLDLCEVI